MVSYAKFKILKSYIIIKMLKFSYGSVITWFSYKLMTRHCEIITLYHLHRLHILHKSFVSSRAHFHPYFVQQIVRSRVRTRFHGPFGIEKIDVFPRTKEVYPEEWILKGPRKIGTQRKTPAFFASFLTKQLDRRSYKLISSVQMYVTMLCFFFISLFLYKILRFLL